MYIYIYLLGSLFQMKASTTFDPGSVCSYFPVDPTSGVDSVFKLIEFNEDKYLCRLWIVVKF